MKGFLVSAMAALSAASVANANVGPFENGQLNMGIGSHFNANWNAVQPSSKSVQGGGGPKLVVSSQPYPNGGPSYLDRDPVLSATMGVGGPTRIELPLEEQEMAAFGGAKSVEDIISNQNGEFVVLTHRDFPQVNVRIKQLNQKKSSSLDVEAVKHGHIDPDAFCDPTVTSWSGYIDTIDGKSLFFYFFESRSNPEKDPVIFWTNGGPGCSSSLGLFMELGPCRIPERGGKLSDGPPINGTVYHPQSWTNRANVFFVDQPVGVGYSYTRYGIKSHNTQDAAKDIYRFLRVFFSAFDKFRDNDFHMAGESYGGRYIPVFASEVADRNAEIVRAAQKARKEPRRDELINLKSIMVGNGLTDPAKQARSTYDMTCTKRGGVNPLLSIETCTRMATWASRCEKWLVKNCDETYSADICRAASTICSEELAEPYSATGQNPYNILDDCPSGLDPDLCYSVTADIRGYLDRKDVRALIGAASKEEIGSFQSCSESVDQGFHWFNDPFANTAFYVAGLLERNIKALIYVGDLDWICNWVGNKHWVSTLDWSGNGEWNAAKNYKWIVDGNEAGEAQSGAGLTWATVHNAGHMVPYDQPDRALALVNRWLDGEKL